MLSKFFSLILTLIVTTQVSLAASQEGLKKAFDQYNYTLSVEWDHHNPEIAYQAASDFMGKVKAMGLSNDAVVDYVASRIKDARVSAEMKDLYSKITNHEVSQDELQEILDQSEAKAYASGASWAGDNNAGTFLFFLLFAFFFIGAA